jgi:hypothetical protein
LATWFSIVIASPRRSSAFPPSATTSLMPTSSRQRPPDQPIATEPFIPASSPRYRRKYNGSGACASVTLMGRYRP